MRYRSIVAGVRRLIHRRKADQELDEEIAHYLEMATREYMRRGLSREAAERAARVGFGGVEAAKEGVRTAGWEAILESLSADLRYAVRGLRRTPGFAVASLLTLALGIGVNTAMFSVVNAALLRPLPYRDAEQLVLIWTDDARRGLHEEPTSSRTIGDWQDANHTLQTIAFYSAGRSTIAAPGDRERTRRAFVSGNFFATLGVAPSIGRWVGDDDIRGEAPVAVISHSLWQHRFGGDSAVIGKTLTLEEPGKAGAGSYRIVGIMPADFHFPDPATELWTPATTYWRYARESVEYFPDWARRWVAVGRMRRGASAMEVRSDLTEVGRHLTSEYGVGPADFPGFTPNVVPLRDSITGASVQTALWLLLGAVMLVLGVACANVANLLLARGAARCHELVLRRALGAGRARLVRQLLVESVVLALGGGALGVALAVVGTRGLVLLAAARLPRVEGIGIDGHVLAFAVMISFAAGIVFGLVPALRLSSLDSHDVVKESRWSARPPGRGAARELLIVAECALTIVLLAGAGLLLRSLERLRSVNPGFDPRHVLIMRLYFPPETPTSAANGAENLDVARARFREQMLNDLAMRLAHVPRVDGLGFIDDMFITGRGNTSITIPAHAEATLNAELNDATVSPGLFEALHVPLRAGRLLTLDDALTKIRALWPPASSNDSLAAQERSVLVEPIVVNETFARRFFPNETPISKRFCIDCTRKPYWYEIVGVVGDMRRQGLERPPIPEYFGPLVPSSLGRADLVLRVEGDAMSAAPLVRQIVRTSMPNGLIAEVSTAEAELGQFSADRRFDAWLLSLFAALALALAAVGVYGVVHYSVAERTREIGIRIALGAGIDEVVRLVVRQGIRAPLVGVALGVIGALAVTRIMTRLLFGTTSADPATYLAVTLTLVVAAGFACYFPARRAATIDPMIALRRN